MSYIYKGMAAGLAGASVLAALLLINAETGAGACADRETAKATENSKMWTIRMGNTLSPDSSALRAPRVDKLLELGG